MCAIMAAFVSHVIFNSHVWVDGSCSPSGRLITSGEVVTYLFMTGVPGTAKCDVAPASAIAISIAILILAVSIIVWGPMELSDCNAIAMLFHAFALDGNVFSLAECCFSTHVFYNCMFSQ